MKKILLITFFLTTVVGVVSARNYNVPNSVNAVTVDGVMTTGEWDDAITVYVGLPYIITAPREGQMTGGIMDVFDSADDYSNTIYFKWDADYLYIAMDVKDDVYWETKNDFAQICFNILNDPAAQFQVESIIWNLDPDSGIYVNDSLAAASSTMESTFVTGGYVLEVAVAWSDFDSIVPGYSPASGDVHGIGFLIQDYDDTVPVTGGIARDLKLQTFTGSLVVPADWNTITLKNQSELVTGDLGYAPSDIDQDGKVALTDFATLAQNWLACSDANDPLCGNYR